jgi:hypothetical protein
MPGKIGDDPVPMSVGAVSPGNENNGVTLPHLNVMDIIPLNYDELIHSVLRFRISFMVVIFYLVAAASRQQ